VVLGLVLIIVLVSILVVSFAGHLFELGYKVELSGEATHWGWPDDDYRVSVDDEEITDDNSLWPLLFGLFSSKHMLIKVEVQGPKGESYDAETWIDKLGDVGTNKLPWSVTFRHLGPGSYDCYIEMWEVEKGFLGLSEVGRDLKATSTYYFEIIPEEIEE
jgi:hypothetical protein